MFEKIKKFFKKEEEKPAPPADEHISELYADLKTDAVKIFIGSDLSIYYDDLGSKIWDFRDNLFEKKRVCFSFG